MNTGSERIQINLTKQSPNQSWGFRLQGGADFTTPLSIQSVTSGGVAERCGLRAGDAVLTLNERPSDEIEHEAAKQMILMAGNQVNLLVQRGAVKVWAPKVTPLSQLRPDQVRPGGDALNGPDPYVQRTSLAADKQESTPIGTGYNRTARPFPGFGGGSAPSSSQPPASAPAAPWASPASAQQYTPPPQPASTNQNAGQYGGGAQAVSAGMGNLHLSDSRLPASCPSTLTTFAPQLHVTAIEDEGTDLGDTAPPPPPPPLSPSLQLIRELEQHSIGPGANFIAIGDGGGAPARRPHSPSFSALERCTAAESASNPAHPSVLTPEPGSVVAGSNTGTGQPMSGGSSDVGRAQPGNAQTTGSAHLGVREPLPVRALSPTMLLIQEEQEHRRQQQQQQNQPPQQQHQHKQPHGPASTSASAHTGPTARSTTPPDVTQLHIEKPSDYSKLSTHRAVAPGSHVTSPARFQEQEEQDYPSYHGYMDHSKQSRSFKLLQAEVGDEDESGGAMPSGIRSVRAPTTKPPGERKQEAQYMTCQVCGTLCVGVFIRVKGEPMHPECYKCADCGTSLKNQGFYTVAERLYCSDCAPRAHQAAGGNPQTVYR